MKEFFKKLWNVWKKIAHTIGRFNTKVILTVFYFLVAGPVCALMKLFRADPTGRRRVSSDSFWKDHEAVEDHFESARRLF